MKTCRQDYENRYHKTAAALPFDAYERIWNAAQAALIADAKPVAEVAESFLFVLRNRSDGKRWPVGTKLYVKPEDEA